MLLLWDRTPTWNRFCGFMALCDLSPPGKTGQQILRQWRDSNIIKRQVSPDLISLKGTWDTAIPVPITPHGLNTSTTVQRFGIETILYNINVINQAVRTVKRVLISNPAAHGPLFLGLPWPRNSNYLSSPPLDLCSDVLLWNQGFPLVLLEFCYPRMLDSQSVAPAHEIRSQPLVSDAT